MPSPDLQLRRAGMLLHPTSLPSGVLDEDVEKWLQLMSDTGFSVWQVLPLGEPQSGLSPYQCSSAFAFNPVLLPVIPADDSTDNDFIDFCQKQNFWLDDYALFKILKQKFDDASWHTWPSNFKHRDTQSLNDSVEEHAQAIVEFKWQQYQLHKRWQAIRDKASDLNILLFGDMPIYIGHDSADVWAHQDWFLLDTEGEMKVVTGVPPDYFSETGQRWGNPHYDWDTMRADGFSWWKNRVKHHLELFDLVRIDHFRGLEAAWVIDASCDTAIDGQWQKMPGDELLQVIMTSIEECHDQLPFVAEDLGIITPEVTALRKKYHLPGMSILQFGFDEFEDNPHKPQNIEEDTVVYTGTHDNDTTKGWFNNLKPHVQRHVLATLNLPSTYDTASAPDEHDVTHEYGHCWHDNADIADLVVEKLIDNALQSRANICIIPVQDCLHLDSDARMNVPGTTMGNWQWRLRWQQIETQNDSDRIKKIRMRNENSQRFVQPHR